MNKFYYLTAVHSKCFNTQQWTITRWSCARRRSKGRVLFSFKNNVSFKQPTDLSTQHFTGRNMSSALYILYLSPWLINMSGVHVAWQEECSALLFFLTTYFFCVQLQRFINKTTKPDQHLEFFLNEWLIKNCWASNQGLLHSPVLCQHRMLLMWWMLYCVSSFSFAVRASLAPSPQLAWILVISPGPAGTSASGSPALVSPEQVCPPVPCTCPLAPAAGAALPHSVSAASLARAPNALARAAAVPGHAGSEPSPHGASPGSSVSPARGAHLSPAGAPLRREMPAAVQ